MKNKIFNISMWFFGGVTILSILMIIIFSNRTVNEIIDGDNRKTIDLYGEKVVLFTQKSCVFCKREKEYLVRNNIKFIELDITSNKRNREYLYTKFNQFSVPFLVTSKKSLLGYNKDRLKMIFLNYNPNKNIEVI